MKKKIISIVTLLCLLVSCLPMSAFAGESYEPAISSSLKLNESDTIEWKVDNDIENIELSIEIDRYNRRCSCIFYNNDLIIEIYNDSNELVKSETIQVVNYKQYFKINIDSLKSGTYNIIVKSNCRYERYIDPNSIEDENYNIGECIKHNYYIGYSILYKTYDITAKNMKLNVHKVTLAKGKSKIIKASINPEDSVYNDVTWSSSNSKIATVSSRGLIKAKNLGIAKITAKSGKLKDTCTVKVNETSLRIVKNNTKDLNKYVKNISGYKNAKWTSSNSSIISVDKNGKIKANKIGTATITASIKGNKYKIKVKSVNKVSCYVNYIDDVYIYNDCYITFTNNTNKKVSYIELNIKQYDNKWSRLNSPYKKYTLNSYLSPHSSGTWCYWVNDKCKHAKVYITKVYFSDGSTWTP